MYQEKYQEELHKYLSKQLPVLIFGILFWVLILVALILCLLWIFNPNFGWKPFVASIVIFVMDHLILSILRSHFEAKFKKMLID